MVAFHFWSNLFNFFCCYKIKIIFFTISELDEFLISLICLCTWMSLIRFNKGLHQLLISKTLISENICFGSIIIFNYIYVVVINIIGQSYFDLSFSLISMLYKNPLLFRKDFLNFFLYFTFLSFYLVLRFYGLLCSTCIFPVILYCALSLRKIIQMEVHLKIVFQTKYENCPGFTFFLFCILYEKKMWIFVQI